MGYTIAFFFFFFFKQKTAYEMRISDWSSDVCSSDLLCANLHYDGTNWRLKRTASGAAALILEGNALNGAIDFYRVAGGTAGATASLSSQLAIGSDGILPGSDNVFNLGNSGKRFTVIYATTGRSEEHTSELQSL